MGLTCNGINIRTSELREFLKELAQPHPIDNGLLPIDRLYEATSKTGQCYRSVTLLHPVLLQIGDEIVSAVDEYTFPVLTESQNQGHESDESDIPRPVRDGLELKGGGKDGHWEYKGAKFTREDIHRQLTGFYIDPPTGTGSLVASQIYTQKNDCGRSVIDRIELDQPLYWVVGEYPLSSYREITFHCGEQEDCTPHDFVLLCQDELGCANADWADNGWYINRQLSRSSVAEFGHPCNTNVEWWRYVLRERDERERAEKFVAGLVSGYLVP